MLVLDLVFFLNWIYFFIAIFIAWTIPGMVLLKRFQYSLFQSVVIGTVIGMSLWGWQGFVFGYLHLRWVSYLYLLCFFIVFVIQCKEVNRWRFPRVRRLDGFVMALIGLGVLIQVSIVWFTGVTYTDGIRFCCGDVSADIYHLGMTYSLTQHIPPFEAEMSQTFVTNYHYWSNLLMAELIRVFHLPLLHAEFQYAAPLISLELGLLAIIFSELLALGKQFTRWLLFFLYFGGDLLYLLQFIITRHIDLRLGPLENGAAFLENPPRAFAIVVFLAGVLVMIRWMQKKDFFTTVLLAFVFGSLIGLKVYIGIFVLSGLFFLAVYYFFKKDFFGVLLFLLSFFTTLVVYLPVNSGAGGLFFTGFWRFEEFISQPLLGLSNLNVAMQIYQAHHNWIKIALYEVLFFILYTVGIFGTKLIAFMQNRQSLRMFPKEINIFFISALVVNFFIGLFFQQNSGGSNSFNFLVSVYIFGSLYTALACTWLLRRTAKTLQGVFIMLIIASNIPRIFYTETTTLSTLIDSKGAFVDENNLSAMAYIRNHTEQSAIVLSNASWYLVFIAQRPVFLGDSGILESHSVDTALRKKERVEILTSNYSVKVKELIRENNITYLYLTSSTKLPNRTSEFLTQVFNNQTIKILRVNVPQINSQ